MKYLLLLLIFILPYQKAMAIDYILVLKSQRTMLLLDNDKIVKEYKISLGKNPEGHKGFQGDSKTPEGKYHITHKNPTSKFHLSLGISYPNNADKANAQKMGRSPGGDIMIHGLPNKFNPKMYGALNGVDWTRGCIAVQNFEMNEIYNIVNVGTIIDIRK